jgi:hypothetical protein
MSLLSNFKIRENGEGRGLDKSDDKSVAFTVNTARWTKATVLSEDVIIRSGNSHDRKQACSTTTFGRRNA